ncbi:MAG: ABC transporter permease [Verrucomicrobiales bacterium]
MNASASTGLPFKIFSPLRVWALAANTFTQLLRMRTLYFLIVFGAVLVVFGFILPAPPTGEGLSSFGGEQELRLLKSVSLGAISWFTVILAIAATAMLLPRDFEDRTLYTILSKPVPRFEYLLGKLAGVFLLLLLCLALMDLACCAAIWLKQRSVTAEEIAYWKHLNLLTPEKFAEIQTVYTRHGLSWNFQAAVAGIFFQGTIMAAVCLLVSTFATSSLFTILIGLAIFVIGQGQELARDFALHGFGSGSQRAISIILALIFPDLRQFNIIDEVVAGNTVPLWLLGEMAGLALLYLVFYKTLAWFIFAGREL